MKSNPYNVVLIPPDDIADQAKRINADLRRFGTVISFQNDECVPHVSVYMLQLKDDDLAEVERRLASIAEASNSLKLVATKYRTWQRYFDAQYAKTSEIADLQHKVIEALNPLRDGMRDKDKERIKDASGAELYNLEKYGWRSVGELYRPHLITRFQAEADQSYDGMLPASQNFSGTYAKLGLFAMGDNGTAIKKLAEFPLRRT